MKCNAHNCNQPQRARGYCSTHWARWRKHGSVADPYNDVMERFFNFIDVGNKGCWLWRGYSKSTGYALFTIGYTTFRAHRFSYMVFNGTIPKGLVVDHLCRVTRCVNPEHLEAVTQKENTNRGVGAWATRKPATHCKRGHKFTEGSYYTFKNKWGRTCKKCTIINQKRLRARS